MLNHPPERRVSPKEKEGGSPGSLLLPTIEQNIKLVSTSESFKILGQGDLDIPIDCMPWSCKGTLLVILKAQFHHCLLVLALRLG